MKWKNALRGMSVAVIAAAFGMSQLGDVDAASLAAKVLVNISGTYSNPLDLDVTPEAKFNIGSTISLANGVAANQADRVFTDQRTLTASSTEDLDVNAGGLTDAFGTTFTLAKLKVLLVCAASSNTNNVVILGDVNSVPVLDTAATTHTIRPGGCALFSNPTLGGFTVTAATGDIIQVANSGGGTSVVYDVLMIGTSS